MNMLLFMTAGMSLARWHEAGILKRELALYERLSSMGVVIGIVSYGGKEERAIAAQHPWLKVHANVWGLSSERYERMLPLLHAGPLMRADILKSNQMSGADTALRCARIWNKPFIARCGYMWSEFASAQGNALAAAIDELERQVFSQARHCIVTTQAMRESVLARIPLSPDRISVFPNFVPEYLFDAPLRHVASPGIRICQVGRLSAQKNLPSLLLACQGLPVTVRLVGEGPDREALRAQAEDLRVDLEMPGLVPHENLAAELDAAAICTLVSHYEGHPKALLEYMARGRPVLGTDAPGIAGIIRHDENGLLCALDPASIREGLLRLLNDPALCARLGERARQDARAFSLQATAEREFALYAQVQEQPTSASLPCAVKFAAKFAARYPVRFAARMARAVARRGLDKFATAVASSPRMANRLRPLLTPATPPAPAPVVAPPSVLSVPAATPRFNLEGTVESLAMECAQLPPADALRLVFTLENKLYSQAGNLAVAYDGGVHTKHRHTQYHEFFIQRLSAGDRVLDIGCGNGFLAYDMAMQADAVVTGIDLNPDNIAVAKARFRHASATYICGNALTDLPLGQFDVVVLSNVLEHLAERVAFLRQVQERLAPKRYLIRVPVFERDWRVPLKKELGLEWRLDTTHETEYTSESFLQEVRDAALVVQHIEFRWSEIWCELTPAN